MQTESKRQQRFGGVIQQDLAEIFLREGSSWLPDVMITVTRVRMTPDLGIARVYLSFFKASDEAAALEKINKKKGEIRFRLGNKIKHQAKNVPELEFFVDDSADYTEKMEQLFDKINKEDRSEE